MKTYYYYAIHSSQPFTFNGLHTTSTKLEFLIEEIKSQIAKKQNLSPKDIIVQQLNNIH